MMVRASSWKVQNKTWTEKGGLFLCICQFANLLVFDATTASATVVMIAISLSKYEQGGLLQLQCIQINALRLCSS